MILSLSEKERQQGVATFSTGNHGLAVAYVASKLGIPVYKVQYPGVPWLKWML